MGRGSKHMARPSHPSTVPSMNYFYIGCQPRKCMNLDARCRPVNSQLSSFHSLSFHIVDPFTFLGQNMCWAPSKMVHERVWAGGTRGLLFLSLTETRPAHALDLTETLCLFLQSSSSLGCC